MADIDEILVCPECLHPVEMLVMCPACDKPVKKMPSLLLPTLRVLRAKGWIVESWGGKEYNTPMVGVEISFYRFAPPLLHGSMRILPSLKNSNAVITIESSSETNAWIDMYQWAKGAPCFAIPFGQDICDICRGQAISWYFSECICPENGKVSRPVHFADGLPAKCIYADAQVVTLENRFKQLKLFFQKNPIARRKAMRQMPRQICIDVCRGT